MSSPLDKLIAVVSTFAEMIVQNWYFGLLVVLIAFLLFAYIMMFDPPITWGVNNTPAIIENVTNFTNNVTI